jgi:uncharacterized protein
MACPNCDTPLVELERSGVTIDACPQCRGVWLDRGELDRVLERERQITAGVQDPDRDFIRDVTGPTGPYAPRPQEPRRYASEDDRSREFRHRNDDRYDDRRRKKKSKFSMLEDLFDFD